MDDELVNEYAETIKDWIAASPITVVSNTHTRWAADCFHRVRAAETAGLDAVPAIQLNGTRRNALLRACGANATHGARRTNADKRQAIETLLRDGEGKRTAAVQGAGIGAFPLPAAPVP
jgi:ParB-like chromosome segregation protein Spo0J